MAVRVRQSESNAGKTSTLEDDKYDRLNRAHQGFTGNASASKGV